jgi:hypothetical protein
MHATMLYNACVLLVPQSLLGRRGKSQATQSAGTEQPSQCELQRQPVNFTMKVYGSFCVYATA